MKFDLEEIKKYIDSQSRETKIYIGCDSERFRNKGLWYAHYTLVVVVHIDGKHGCKIFGEVQTEKDYDQKASKPSFRLMNEVFKISELYLKLADVIDDREFEVDLDINPKEEHNSSVVLSQAVGYIKGTCNVTPLVKPNAFAATYAADRLRELKIA
jgi:hypothetical protein